MTPPPLPQELYDAKILRVTITRSAEQVASCKQPCEKETGCYSPDPGVDPRHLITSKAGTRPIHAPMPHLIFQIDEILRPIADYVGQASRPTAVEFARCCRAFEEPALRPLWESTTVGNLMYVLPGDVLCFGGPGLSVVSSLSSFFELAQH